MRTQLEGVQVFCLAVNQPHRLQGLWAGCPAMWQPAGGAQEQSSWAVSPAPAHCHSLSPGWRGGGLPGLTTPHPMPAAPRAPAPSLC